MYIKQYKFLKVVGQEKYPNSNRFVQIDVLCSGDHPGNA